MTSYPCRIATCVTLAWTRAVKGAPRTSGDQPASAALLTYAIRPSAPRHFAGSTAMDAEKPSAGTANIPARSPFAGGAMLTKDASNRFATNAMLSFLLTVFVWLATAVGAMTAGWVSFTIALKTSADAEP